MSTHTDKPQTSYGDGDPDTDVETDRARRQRKAMTRVESISLEQYHTLQSRRESALALPPTGDVWEVHEIDGLETPTICAFHSAGVIICTERNVGGLNKWMTAPSIYPWITEHLTGHSTCPGADGADCQDTGIRCLEAGERYTCTDPDCEARFGAAAAREIMTGETADEPSGGAT